MTTRVDTRVARALAAALYLVAAASAAEPQDDGPAVLRVGHWVEVKGALDASGSFRAAAVEIVAPDEHPSVIASVRAATPEALVVLGRRVELYARTRFVGVERDGLAQLIGRRVKVELRWRPGDGDDDDDGALEAREISARDGGRDRIAGRVDALRRRAGGVELAVAGFSVLVPEDERVEHALPLERIALAPSRPGPRPPFDPDAKPLDLRGSEREEEDRIPGRYRLGESLSFGATLELESTSERDFDLDRDDDEDRRDDELTLRGRLYWSPGGRVSGLATVRQRLRRRFDEEDGRELDGFTRLGETTVTVQDLLVPGLAVGVGRHDFDEPREWIWDRELDGARVVLARGALRAEVAATTLVGAGAERDEESVNLMAYVSHAEHGRELAAWVLDRRIEIDGVDDFPFHVGVRALGEWLPASDVWLEAALLTGFRADDDLRGVGFDVGGTFRPAFAGPFALTLGYAFGSGDASPNDGVDRNFRQTGFQDNNAKLAGVTSFRYYGELFDPELSNLSIATVGLGTRVAPKTSLELVWHGYRQDEAADFFAGEAGIGARPSGASRDLGWELDLVLGSRRFRGVELELVAAWFHPGAGFDERDDAFLGRIQLRFDL